MNLKPSNPIRDRRRGADEKRHHQRRDEPRRTIAQPHGSSPPLCCASSVNRRYDAGDRVWAPAAPGKVTIVGDVRRTSAMISIWIAVAAVDGLLAVAAGAAASHLFADDPRRLAWMSTGAQYALYHAAALLALAALADRAKGSAAFLAAAASLFIAGMVLFSGSLYLLALTGLPGWAWATPWGGTAFMLGWASLGIHAWRARAVR